MKEVSIQNGDLCFASKAFSDSKKGLAAKCTLCKAAQNVIVHHLWGPYINA